MTNMLMFMVVGMVPLLGGMVQKRLRPLVETHLDYIEAELSLRPWFAGNDISAADVMMSFPVEFGMARVNAGEGRPHLKAWLEKVQARPAYVAALEAGGPYSLG